MDRNRHTAPMVLSSSKELQLRRYRRNCHKATTWSKEKVFREKYKKELYQSIKQSLYKCIFHRRKVKLRWSKKDLEWNRGPGSLRIWPYRVFTTQAPFTWLNRYHMTQSLSHDSIAITWLNRYHKTQSLSQRTPLESILEALPVM